MVDVYSFAPDVSESGIWDFVLATTFQPGTPIYEALPSALLGTMRVGTLAQRIEGRQMLIGAVDPQNPYGAWLRIEGERIDATPESSSTGLSYDQDIWRLQGGLDILVHEGDRGNWVAGVNVFTVGSSVDVASPVGGGDISTDAMGVGLTATWYGHDGFYADSQLQYASFESDVSSDGLGALVMGLDGSSRLASIEMGQEFTRPNGLTWTPQAQLTWSEVSFDTFTGPNAEVVSIGDNDSLQLRLGLAVERAWDFGNGEQARLYGIANVHHELRSRTSVMVSGTELAISAPDWVGEIGLGGSYDWANEGGGTSSLYGEISASRELSRGELRGLAGTIGFRIEF